MWAWRRVPHSCSAVLTQRQRTRPAKLATRLEVPPSTAVRHVGDRVQRPFVHPREAGSLPIGLPVRTDDIRTSAREAPRPAEPTWPPYTCAAGRRDHGQQVQLGRLARLGRMCQMHWRVVVPIDRCPRNRLR